MIHQRAVAGIVALVLVAAACGGSGDPVVASVDDVEIHRSEVVALRTAPDEAVELDSGEFRNELMYLVAQAALEVSLEEEFGITISDADVAAELDVSLERDGIDLDRAIADLDDPAATDERLRRIVKSRLLRDQGQMAVVTTDDYLDDVFLNRAELITTVCVRHVLVGNASAAQIVKSRLEQGADLAAVADEVSLDDATPGGDLGCTSASQFVDAFSIAAMTAPIGKPFGPVQTEFGFHVLVVDSRTTATRPEVVAAPQQYFADVVVQTEFTNWFNDRLREREITVAGEVGTWFPEGPGILPPERSG